MRAAAEPKDDEPFNDDGLQAGIEKWLGEISPMPPLLSKDRLMDDGFFGPVSAS